MAKVVKAKNFVSNSAPKVVKASESFQLSQDFLEKSLKEEQNKQIVTEMIKQTGVGYNPTQAIINKTSVVDNIAKSKGYKNTAEMNRYQQNNPNLYEAMGGNKYNPIPSKTPTVFSDEGKQIVTEAQKADKQYRDNLSGLQEARQKVEKSKKTYEDTKSYKGYGNVEKALNYVGGVNSNLIESSKADYEKSAAEYVAIKYHNEAAAENALTNLEKQLKDLNNFEIDIYGNYSKETDKKRAELKNEIDILRTALYGKYTVGQYLWENVNTGAARWNQSLSATADFTAGNVLKAFGFEDNAISKWNNWHKEEVAKAEERATNAAKAVGDNKNIGGQVTQGVVMALPDLLLAAASGGTSKVARLGPKATGLLNTVKNTIVSLAKNPSYWSSYIRELGTNYEQAKEDGATETEATLYTLLASSANAAVEVGGGIQTLPDELQKAYNTNKVWSWFKSALEEGGEENIQGIISGLTEKVTYNPEKEIASFTNEDAIVNPKAMAKEFGMGVAVGGILGGGNLIVDTVLNAKTESAYKQIGQAVLNDKNIDINGIVDYAKKSLDDGIRDLALDTNVNKITPRTVGILYKYAISDISSSINSAENIEVATKNYENIVSSTQSPIINSIASSQYILRLMENGMTEENAFAQTESVTENIQSQELSGKENRDIITDKENNTNGAEINVENNTQERGQIGNTQGSIRPLQENLGGNNDQSRTEGLEQRGSQSLRDSENRGSITLNSVQFEALKNTAIRNEDGTPKIVYHFTDNMDFETFAVGDIGFHFGNETQAKSRGDLLKKTGRIIKAGLNIKNPLKISTDIMSWRPRNLALKLLSDGLITVEQYRNILNLDSGEVAYDTDAAIELRRILADKGYDGISYPNMFEGEGESYIAFYPEQVIIVDNGKSFSQSSAKDDGLSESEADMVAVNPKNTKRRHTNAKEQNYIKSVGKDLGVKVVFEDIVKVLSAEGIDLHGNIPDGYIDDDGVIHINFTVVNPTKVVFKHELTHYGEGTEAHATYTAAVEKTKLFKEWLQKKTGSNSDSVGELKGIYRDMVKKQRGSLAPKGATKLNNEMFADFSSEVLFDTASFEQLINQVNAKQKPAVIQYVLDFLAYLKDKLSGKKNITFELKRLESAYAAMLREATQKENTADNGGVRYSVVSKEQLQQIQNIGNKSINSLSQKELKSLEPIALQYWNDMKEKSPFFRSWFGDWRAFDKSKIQIANVKGENRGLQKNNDTGWDINVSSTVFNETKTHKNITAITARKYLPYIQDIVKKAVLLDSFGMKDLKSENSLLMHSFYVVADIGNGPELLKLYVEEMNNPIDFKSSKRAYKLNNIESRQLSVVGSQKNASPITSTVGIKNISDLFAVVKQKDYSFNPKPVNPMFLNEDGTPKKFYHGTNADFTVFDRSKSAKKIHLNVLGDGNYFTAKRQGAEKYGTNVLEVYLSVKNPYIFKSSEFNTVADQISNEYSIDRNEIKGSNVQSFLKEKNFDGVVLLDENGKAIIVNAFDSNQIKSATDNIGTFDSNNPDIRFSVPAVTEQQAEQDSDKAEQDIIKEAKKLRERYNNGEISREEYREGLNDLWTDAADRFGTFPQGENAVEEIPVPKKVAKAKPNKRFIRTIIESGKLTDDMLEDVSAEVLTGDMTYEVVSDESAQNHAKKLINSDTAELSWNEAVGKGIISKNEIALGEMLLVDAIERNDRVRVLELSAELADLFSRAGQAVQAAKMLKKMTGVGRLLTVQQFVRTTNKDLIEKYGEDVREVKLNPKLAEQLAETETEEDIENVYKDILVDVASQMPATFLDKLNAWRYFAMLANPRTHIRNLLGNTIFTPVVVLKNATAAAAERLIKDTSQRTKSVIIKKEYLDFAKKDIKSKETKMLLEGSGQLDTKGRVNELRRTFENEFLEKLTNGNSNFLEKEDMWFKSIHYKMALAGYLQAQKVDLKNVSENTLKAARDYAIQEAKKATFQDASVIADMLNNIRTPKSWKGKKGAETTVTVAKFAVEGVLPFKRTPINIIKRGVEYSPIGLFETLTAGVYQVSKGDITISEFCDGLASGFIGSSLAAVGYLLASTGLVNGGFGDDEEDKFKQLNGEQEYSIKIGGKSYSIDWAAPACIPFFIGVELAQEIAESDGFQLRDITDSLWHVLEPITNLSMLSGVQGLIDSVKYEEGSKTLGAVAGNLATSFAMQFIPSTLGAASRTIDPVQRNWYTDKNSQIDSFGQSVINNVKSKIPGLSYTMTPKIDAWGQEVRRGGVGERLAENFASPGYYSEVNYNELDNELLRLGKATGENVYPKTAAKSFSVDGETKYLTAKEYVTYAKAKGMYSYDYIDELMANKAYKKLTDEEKAEVIKNLYKYANAKAKVKVSDYDITKSFKTVSRREENGYSPVDYYIYLALKK